jgi:hypothetical protein
MTLTGAPRKWLAIGVALLLLGLVKMATIGWFWMHRAGSGTPEAQLLVCRIEQQACNLPGGGQARFAAQPQKGKPFDIVLEGVGSAGATAEFTMPGMEMGFNRYRFVADGTRWHARVTLPVCATGSRHWEMTLDTAGHRYKLPFNVQ